MANKVSIIIPVFNGEKYIKKCLDSLNNQDYQNIEIIVIDDGSTDNTISIVKKYSNVTLFRQANKGANCARNKGVELSSGSYIKFLDADDYLAKNAIVKQVNRLEKCEKNEIPYGFSRNFYDKKSKLRKVKFILNKKNQTTKLILGNIQTSLPLHRREAITQVQAFNPLMTSRQEWQMHIKLSLAGYKFIYFDDEILFQLQHDDPNRITNRIKIPALELKNLDEAFKGLKSTNNDVSDAFACYVWKIGRQFYLMGDFGAAKMFYAWSINLSGDGYKKYFTLYDKIINIFYGPRFARFVRLARKIINIY